MTEDFAAMMRLGVTVLMVASLIATVLSLVVIATTIIATGTTKMQAGASKISTQDFEQYNQKPISGVNVKTAIQLYGEQNISVAVCTKRNPGSYYIYGALLQGATNGNSNTPATISASTLESTANVNGTTNAYYTMELQFDTSTQTIPKSNVRDGINITGTAEYIYDGGHFNSRLIKDSNGEIVGIACKQVD